MTRWLASLNRFQVILILTALGLLAFANAVNHPFVHDDVAFIQQNPYIADLDPKSLFEQTSVPLSQSPLINQYYRPLLEVVNRILYRVMGPNPHGFHFFNILLHIINGYLVYQLLWKVTGGSKGLSLIAAILFLVHPVQSEAVACISGISNLVFAFFCLVSFNLYLSALHGEDGKIKSGSYAAALTVFSLALLAKEQSVVLPVLIMAYEACFSGGRFKRAVRKYGLYCAGFFVVLAGYFLLRKFLFGFSLTPVPGSRAELGLRLLAIPRTLLTYFRLIIFPHGLHYYRSQDILLPYLWPLLLLIAVGIAAVWLMTVTPRPQKHWMLFGSAWYGIALLPTLNIVPLVNEYSTVQTAEHFLYFPVIGVFLCFLAAAEHWVVQQDGGRSHGLVFWVCTAIAALCVAMTAYQNTFWRGEIPLFERTLRYEPGFGRVRLHLAKAYTQAGRYEDAIVEAQKALAIMERYVEKVKNEKVEGFYLRFITEIHYLLGFCYDILGERDQAVTYFRKALNLAPEDTTINYSLGLAYLKQGDIGGAITHFERALALNEDNLMAANSLAICYQRIGNYEKAEKLLRLITEKDSASASARQNLSDFLKMRNGL